LEDFSVRINVLGVGFDNLNMNEAVSQALEEIAHRGEGYVVTPNPEIVWLCKENPDFAALVSKARLVLADGVGITLGAKILGQPLKARVPGVDFAAALFAELAKHGQSVFLYGAKPGIAERAGMNLEQQYPGLQIVGTANGYGNSTSVVEAIRTAKPDFLLVCLGAPRQEEFMAKYQGTLGVGLMAGLGGTLDVLAGEVTRAPKGWQKLGLEWLYRLLKDPRRAKRMLKLPLFLFAVIGQRIRGGKA